MAKAKAKERDERRADKEVGRPLLAGIRAGADEVEDVADNLLALQQLLHDNPDRKSVV